jgi:hypothetical protein
LRSDVLVVEKIAVLGMTWQTGGDPWFTANRVKAFEIVAQAWAKTLLSRIAEPMADFITTGYASQMGKVALI